MAILRSSSGGGSVVGVGYKPCDIIDVIDVSEELAFAQFGLKFILDFNGIERDFLVCGDHTYDENGSIVTEGNTLITRFQRCMDMLEIKPYVGFNERGEFETETGEIVTDIVRFLKEHLAGTYWAHLSYKAKPSKDGKYYENVTIIFTDKQEDAAMNYVDFLVSKRRILLDRPEVGEAPTGTTRIPF